MPPHARYRGLCVTCIVEPLQLADLLECCRGLLLGTHFLLVKAGLASRAALLGTDGAWGLGALAP